MFNFFNLLKYNSWKHDNKNRSNMNIIGYAYPRSSNFHRRVVKKGKYFSLFLRKK